MQFSIITLVFNSELFLMDLYNHLKKIHAKFNDFEWILVDDFSTDNSRNIMSKIECSSPPFPVKTIYLSKNYYGSKSTYLATQIASGEYSIILDADDYLTDNALNDYSSIIKRNQTKVGFVGVCGRCEDFRGKFIGTKFKSDETFSNELFVRHVLKIKGEMLQCTKTEIIKLYFYGALPGFANGWVWSRMSQKYNWVYTNKVMRKYNTENYNSASHSYRVRFLQNKVIAAMDYMNVMQKYFLYDPFFWLKKGIMIATASWICKKVYMGKNQNIITQIVLLSFVPLGGLLAVIAILRHGRIKFCINS